MQDFSVPKQDTLKFKIDDDVFEAVPVVGAELLRDVINVTVATELSNVDPLNLSPEQRVEVAGAVRDQATRVTQFIDAVLLEESALRFAERLRSATNPISIQQMFQVWTWLIQEYGNRPTQPSLPSENGHGGTGTSSTVGVLPTA